MKHIISLIALMLFFASCSSQPSPEESLPNNVVVHDVDDMRVDDKVNNAGHSEQMSDTSVDSHGMDSHGSHTEMKVMYFAFDQFNLSDENMEIASSNADILSSNSMSIKLEGNCDEWGSDEYNYALGLKRAKAVKNTIVSNGIDASRISMVSYGESNPYCSERNKSCWSKNRRVETKFLP